MGIVGTMAAGLLTAAVAAGTMAGQIGPDVVVNDLYSIRNWGAVDGIHAFTVGTEACNLGDAEAIWIDTQPSPNQHPVIVQNAYRLSTVDGAPRFDQIGMSWGKHAFCALDFEGCGPCKDTSNCDWLSVGCSDPYDAVTNGTQVRLGPRSEINPWTGAYPYPYVLNWSQIGDLIFKRLQIAGDDLDPALHPGARYFIEAIYLTTDEPAWGTQYNNAAWREVMFEPAGSLYLLRFVAPTVPMQTAVEAWASVDPSVSISSSQVMDIAGTTAVDGVFLLASSVTDLGDGTWHYEYALYNYNVERGAGSFTVPVGEAAVTGVGFRDVDYHSGELHDGTDWAIVPPGAAATTGGGSSVDRSGDRGRSVSWSTDPHASNPAANALAWGTMYTFRFDADAPPADGAITVGLFRPSGPGEPDVIEIAAPVPSSGGFGCPGDANGDGETNAADLSALIGAFGQMVTPGTSGDLNGDGLVNGADLSVLVGSFGCMVPDDAVGGLLGEDAPEATGELRSLAE